MRRWLRGLVELVESPARRRSSQFGRPHGVFGWFAGRVMAALGSNRLRSRRTVELTAVRVERLTAAAPMAVCVIGTAAA